MEALVSLRLFRSSNILVPGLIRIFMITKCCSFLQCRNEYEHVTPLNVIVFLCLSILDATEV